MNRVQVKICGVRDLATAEAVAEGADFMGFIMCPRFWRYIEPDRVKEICESVKVCHKVGVFVDQPVAEVAELAAYCSLDYVQLHGHEGVMYACELRTALYELNVGAEKQIIKAFRYGDDFSADLANHYPADLILIDSYSKNAEGGNGVAFAWRAAAEEIKRVKKPYLIAGGINAANVQEAIEIFAPYGVDASSSLERDKQKDVDLIREFLQKAGKL